MYFVEKCIRRVQWGLGQSARGWGMFENFCVKSNLAICKVTFNCKLQKKLGVGCTSCSPDNFVGGKELLPRFPRLWNISISITQVPTRPKGFSPLNILTKGLIQPRATNKVTQINILTHYFLITFLYPRMCFIVPQKKQKKTLSG